MSNNQSREKQLLLLPFQLTRVVIRNFRCIKELSLDLSHPTTVLIGENNSGKTAFLYAIRRCLDQLGRPHQNPFDEYDYHLSDGTSTPTHAEPIQIDLSFIEPEPDMWNEEILRRMREMIVSDKETGCYEVYFRVKSYFEQGERRFITEWTFLDDRKEPISKNRRQLAALRDVVPVFYLQALRDASKHFASHGKFWREFLSEASIPEKEREQLEKDILEVNRKLIDKHEPLAYVQSHLEGAKKVMDFGSGNAVSIDALPTRLFSLLSHTQVSLSSRAGAKIPVERQGEGTQSLAVLLLFDAFLKIQLRGKSHKNSSPIITLEEPEAHLHPSATRTLMKVVDDLPGQKIVSSHSGDILASVDPLSLRRFVHRDNKIAVHRIDPKINKDEMRKFQFYVRRHRGELLFARCWLLVEGETETTLFNGVAEACGFDLEREGVCCVEFAQTSVDMLAKIANQLGIEWYCVMDNDVGKKKYEKAVQDQLNGVAESDRRIYPYKSIELFLCQNGFGDLYESRMSNQKPRPESPNGTEKYWEEVLKALPNKYSKPAVAFEVILKMKNKELEIPTVFKKILKKAIELARK